MLLYSDLKFVRRENGDTVRIFETSQGEEVKVKVTQTRHGMSISEFTVESSHELEVSSLKKLTDNGPFGFRYSRKTRSTEELYWVYFVIAYTD